MRKFVALLIVLILMSVPTTAFATGYVDVDESTTLLMNSDTETMQHQFNLNEVTSLLSTRIGDDVSLFGVIYLLLLLVVTGIVSIYIYKKQLDNEETD